MKTIDDLIEMVQAWTDQQDADGCQGCAFEETEAWEMPCEKCKRNCRDYWRRKE